MICEAGRSDGLGKAVGPYGFHKLREMGRRGFSKVDFPAAWGGFGAVVRLSQVGCVMVWSLGGRELVAVAARTWSLIILRVGDFGARECATLAPTLH